MMHYELQAVVRPSQQFLKVSGNLTGVEGQEGRFYLNENLEILSACAGGRKIGFWMNREGQRQPVDEVSRPVVFENDGEAFHFQYQGVLPEVMSEVNGIREGLVELAYYSGWYPKPVKKGELFTFTLDLTVPEDYEVAANGDMEEGHLSEALLPGEKCVRIVSRGAVEDIAIFASNQVSRFHDCLEGLDITFLCPQEFAGNIEKREIDGYSYQLGVMDAFLEMVAAGVKRLALSHPFACAEEMDNCREAVEELCQGYGAGCYREESLLVTDLFPAKDGKGVCVYLLYKDEKVLEEYLELKKEKERLTALGLYEGEARERLAIRFGGLLSYGEEASRRLIAKNQDRES